LAIKAKITPEPIYPQVGIFLPMGLNIKNERTVALIRELAARTGQSQTAAIEDAVRSKLAEVGNGDDTTDLRERGAAATRLLAELRGSVTAEERAAVRAAGSDIYDERGLPR